MKKQVITTVLGKVYEIQESDVFVTMTDKYLSGWGCASGKIAKRVMICPNRQKAELIKDRLNNPKHLMKNVNIVYSLPRYNSKRYTVSFDMFSENSFNY